MLDVLLRTIILLLCGLTVVAAGQLALWTVKPWWNALRGQPPNAVVTIEPIGMIEADRVRAVEGRPIASQLSHRLAEISATLSRNISDSHAVLEAADVHVPRIELVGSETYHLLDDTDVTFEVQVFRFDVMGLVTSVHDRLDAGDRVKAMIELRDPQSRLFLDITRANGADRRVVLETAPTLNETLDVAACAIARAYREDTGLFAGLDAHGFCAFIPVLRSFQDFVTQSANRIGNNGEIEFEQVHVLIRQLESPPFAGADVPFVNLLLASLYRVDARENRASERLDSALERLERAAAHVPHHQYVQANLQSWREEKVTRQQASRLAEARPAPPTPSNIQDTYQQVRTQQALAALRIPEMVERLAQIPDRREVTVAIFGTGFTRPRDPAPLPEIRTVINATEEAAEDLHGYGNTVTHLLAAILPVEGISILPVKVLSATGSGRFETTTAGIEQALRAGSDILVLPISGTSRPAENYRILLDRPPEVAAIAAAGNSGLRSDVQFPAGLPGVVAVGGMDQDGGWAGFSSGAEAADIAAPAVNVLLTPSGGELQRQSGTSWSTVIVGALFAAAKSAASDLDQATILELLQTSAEPGEEGQPPRIDALAFIEAVIATTSGRAAVQPDQRLRSVSR